MHDDSQRGGMYSNPRRQYSNYADNKSQNYSPSTSYNYNPAAGNMGNNGQMSQMQRRRPEQAPRFKRETINYSEKLVRQNNIIIKLLQEISDKLSNYGGVAGSTQAIQNDLAALESAHVEGQVEYDAASQESNNPAASAEHDEHFQENKEPE